METVLEVVYPETPMSMNQLTSDKRIMSRIQSQWGPKNSMNHKVNIKVGIVVASMHETSEMTYFAYSGCC